jgi:hypothetical protein
MPVMLAGAHVRRPDHCRVVQQAWSLFQVGPAFEAMARPRRQKYGLISGDRCLSGAIFSDARFLSAPRWITSDCVRQSESAKERGVEKAADMGHPAGAKGQDLQLEG